MGNNYTGVGAARFFFSHRVPADAQPGAQLCVSDFECCRNRRVYVYTCLMIDELAFLIESQRPRAVVLILSRNLLTIELIRK